MRLLHVLRSEPDENLNALIRHVSGDEHTESFKLFGEEVDYSDFIEAVFKADKVFTW